MVIIEGYVHNSVGQPLVGISVEAFQHNPLGDLTLTTFPEITDNEGYFKIIPQRDIDETNSNVYIIITDDSKKFVSVRDRHSRHKRREFFSVGGANGWKWRSQVISNLNNVIEIVVTQNRISVPATYDSVVIGSGFGGTIVSLAIAKMYKEKNENNRVCILERGQWWISHEIPDSNPLRTFLVKNNMPFSTWAYPNDIKGMLAAIGNSRAVNKVQGLFDVKQLKNVNVIVGSGVGGGSLVYFNITEKPERVVYENWPTENDGNPSLDEFYPLAEEFIGVSPITSTAGFGGPPLPKAKVFQEAAKQIGNNKIINIDALDAKLSITDISTNVFNPQDGRPNQGDIKKYTSAMETNICERQGRCGLGCIPGARHTLNKQIFTHINILNLPIDVHPLCEVLEIEELPPGQGYKYAVKFIDYRDIINEDDFSPTKDLTEQDRARLTKVIKTNRVVLAAGTLGSTELLLKSKKMDLSNTVGSKFSTNGDFFGIINPTKYNVDASRGPTQTSIALFKDDTNGQFAFSIEDVGIPQMFAEVFATIFDKMREEKGSVSSAPFIPRKSFITLFSELVLNNVNIDDPQTRNILAKLMGGSNVSILSTLGNIFSTLLNIFSNKRNLTPEERVSNMLVLFGIGRDNNTTSKLTLGNRNRIDLDNNYNLQQPIFDQIINGMKLFAQKIGKEEENSLIIPLWDTQSRRQISAHPIGGCPMGDDASNGVVDSLGRVFRGKNGNKKYDGLYVADGSIIPTSLGVNPSLTISALAYRIAFDIVKRNRDCLPQPIDRLTPH
jgi:choline dehydrogenase-like flavoprotein